MISFTTIPPVRAQASIMVGGGPAEGEADREQEERREGREGG